MSQTKGLPEQKNAFIRQLDELYNHLKKMDKRKTPVDTGVAKSICTHIPLNYDR